MFNYIMDKYYTSKLEDMAIKFIKFSPREDQTASDVLSNLGYTIILYKDPLTNKERVSLGKSIPAPGIYVVVDGEVKTFVSDFTNVAKYLMIKYGVPSAFAINASRIERDKDMQSANKYIENVIKTKNIMTFPYRKYS